MGGGGTPVCPTTDKEDGMAAPLSLPAAEAEPFSNVPLADAPILFLVYFHNALRQELFDLHRMAVLALESLSNLRELLVELRRRFDFLKLAQKYHSAVEDEVIFLALDVNVKNVVHAYSLEHNSIEDLFDSIFHSLDSLIEEPKDNIEPFQELVSSIATIYSCMCQHMSKEEEQVFPLLMQLFSPKEQGSLLWQFFYSIPVILLEELLPWMISFLSPEKQVDVMRCIGEIVPQEISLREVVISWLHRNDRSPFGVFTNLKKEAFDGSMYMKSATKLQFFTNVLEQKLQRKKKICVQTNVGNNFIKYLLILHRSIQKDLKEIQEEAYQSTHSSCLNVDSVVVQLKFLADVIIFYSHALKKFFYPALKEPASKDLSTWSSEQLLIETQIEILHQLLRHDTQNGLPSGKFVEKLCLELKSFLINISRWFYLQEVEVFPLISENCSSDNQQQLMYMSLHLMPLGLLKCVISWFAAHLSENEASSLLHNINQGDNVANESFASLLYEWFHNSYSSKISIENFRKNLQTIFNSRCSFIPEKIREAVPCLSLRSIRQPFGEFRPSTTEPIYANKGKMISSYSSSGSYEDELYGIFYSSEVNVHIFFPGTKRLVRPSSKFPGGESSMSSVIDEPKPSDLIFFFHKALKKDLEYIVSGSARLAGNIGFLMEFSKQFNLLWHRYRFHSATEDEIAFPALEAKGKVQNISNSYTIDHKLEVKLFNKMLRILEKLSELQRSVSTVDLSMQDHGMLKYNQLCMKLHNECKSMHRLLSDHIHHEEIELWPLFRECFSIQEQEKIIGLMLGGAKAETLQDLIPWLTGSLTPEEHQALMLLLCKVTKNTMFDEWLGEWLEGHDVVRVSEKSNTLSTADPLEIISKYLPKGSHGKQGDILCREDIEFSEEDYLGSKIDMLGNCKLDGKGKAFKGNQEDENPKCEKSASKGESKRGNEVTDVRVKIEKPGQPFQSNTTSGNHEQLLTVSQDDLEAAIRKVSWDSSLDPQKKSYIIQNLLMSRWIVQQRKSHINATISSDEEEISGQHPSYCDTLKVTFGCKHYKRNCKLVTPCCNKLYTCIRCHDEEADHSTDRRAITKMMCMKCLVIQPIGKTCITVSCNNLSMARFYCRICKLFDDRREIYHCPYCNLCRVGKGLGVDYFHCMSCNACMSLSLRVHTCREKCSEGNCPICHEYIFTSSAPVKSLPCGHLMHSECFQEYTCTHYICPICSKSLGDMQVYFKMLDALLAEEKMPDEYCSKTQAILCNDCEKKGVSPFHWHYHKCPYCGSYNTRLL